MFVSFVITSLNRIDFLRQTVEAIKANVGPAVRHEIVIADNGSDEPTKSAIGDLGAAYVVTTPRRYGLGGNMNAGIRHAIGSHHFILQDDFVCKFDITAAIQSAEKFLAENPDVGMVRFGSPYDAIRFFPEAYGDDPREKRTEGMILENRGPYVVATAKDPEAWIYSDNPHIRRKGFAGKYGYYIEGFKTFDTEIQFRDKYNKLGGKTAWLKAFETKPPFDHIGHDLSTRTTWGL